jgi:hypothetical protein
LIKLKKTSAKAVAPTKVATAMVPVRSTFPFKVVPPVKPAVPEKVIIKHRELIGKLAQAQAAHAKTATPETAKAMPIAKPLVPAKVYPPHEIIKSNVSLKEDITSNPQDYERQPFDFDLKCSHGHFWPAGKLLPVSNGKAYCLKCGERLRKPKPKKSHRYSRAHMF